MKTPKTSNRRVRSRLKKGRHEMVTLGEQMRLIREARGLSKAEVARLMGMDQDAVTRVEKRFYGGRAFATLNKYLETIGATLIAIHLPHPSFVNHEVHALEQPVPVYHSEEHSLLVDDGEFPDHN